MAFDVLYSETDFSSDYLCLHSIAKALGIQLAFGNTGEFEQCIELQKPSEYLIRSVFDGVQSESSEADTLYWSSRTWMLLCWQPVYLLIAAWIRHGRCPDVTRLSLSVTKEIVLAVDVREKSGGQKILVPVNDGYKKQVTHAMFTLLYACHLVTGIKVSYGKKILSDCILYAVLQNEQHISTSFDELNEIASECLSLFGIEKPLPHHRTTPTLFSKTPSKSELMVHRSACCFHFKLNNQNSCDDCPKRRRNYFCSESVS